MSDVRDPEVQAETEDQKPTSAFQGLTLVGDVGHACDGESCAI